MLTPKGEVIDLPAGATPLDFAYRVHTDIGHRCRGAKIDGRIVTLDYKLRTGERVEVMVGKVSEPRRDWLLPGNRFLASPRSREKVRAWFRRLDRGRNQQAGREILERELKRMGAADADLAPVLQRFHLDGIDELHVQLVDAIEVEALQHRRQVGIGRAHAFQLALEDLASGLLVAAAIEPAEPRADFLPRSRARQEPIAGQQPVAARFADLADHHLDPLAGPQLVVKGHDAAIDLGAAAAMSDVGMHAIGEIQRRGAGRQVDHLALRRQHVDAFLDKFLVEERIYVCLLYTSDAADE